MKRKFLNHTVALNKRVYLLMKELAANGDKTSACACKALLTACKLSDAHIAGTWREMGEYAGRLRSELRQLLKCLHEDYSYDDVNEVTYPKGIVWSESSGQKTESQNGGMVDAADLKSAGDSREGSSPSSGTNELRS